MNDAMQGAWSNDDVRRMRAFPLRVSTLACVVLSLSTALGQTSPVRAAPDSNLPEILAYIHNGWDSLTRSTSSCSGISDPKLSGAPLLYLPAGFNEPIEVEKMQRECGVKVAYLPQVIDKAGTAESDLIDPPGLLYLQNKYVVPGGRFNEMYGWDSYFIIRGLLRDGRVELARGMVENFFFEIEHYGAVLNANRTYYLTRSQPPFLSSMVVAVHEAQKAKGQNDQAWLEKAYGYVKRDHDMWTRDPHLAGSTGLSRYYDFGDGPAMEALQDENDIYRQVAAYFVVHPAVPPLDAEESDVPPGRASGLAYSVRVCSAGASQSSCEPARLIKLKPDYYKGDRSMRESGFDISFRFGPYGAATHHYAPVCLNSLLYKTEKDLQQMAEMLGRKDDAPKWQHRAEERRQLVQRYLWDPVRRLFFDYNFSTGERSSYEYITTLYPLWAGLATKEQAEGVVHNLGILEQPGGLVMSTHDPGVQWDYPYGWAPTQIVAIKGLRRYGFNDDANRVSYKFIS